MLTAIFALVWFKWRERIGRIGFYVLFALVVTASVQLVGVYLVFTSLIVPAVATYRHAPKRQLAIGYALAIGSYVAGLARLAGDRPAVEPGHRVGDGSAGTARAPDGAQRQRRKR